ncbi:hypothetical protein MLD38_019224 [Melastoma candidum]|uniref:Uncharacterized protein n=1 Tax=Melastoma candidum TaxID=119954 RepID=A0ACB9QW91_9MYRT|nr:hypothetical protein MLD38_019224 [Melastoma candidum]
MFTTPPSIPDAHPRHGKPVPDVKVPTPTPEEVEHLEEHALSEDEEDNWADIFDIDPYAVDNEVYSSLVLDSTLVDAFRTPFAHASTSSIPVAPRKTRKGRPPVVKQRFARGKDEGVSWMSPRRKV